MADEISFHFVANVIESNHDGVKRYMDVGVQVWKDGKHVETVQLAELMPVDIGGHVSLDTVETYALAAMRAVGRHLSDVHMNAIDADALHRRDTWT